VTGQITVATAPQIQRTLLNGGLLAGAGSGNVEG
jgi:hypothetical protein